MDRDKAIRAALLTAKGIKNRNGFDQGGGSPNRMTAYNQARASAEPMKGINYSELLADNIFGLDNEYLSAGERLKQEIKSDPLGFLKNAGISAYEGAKQTVTQPLTTAEALFSGLYDSGVNVARTLGPDPTYLNNALQEMYGVTFDEATDEQVTAAREALIGDVLNVAPVAGAAAQLSKSALKAIDDAQLRQLDEFIDLYESPKQDVSTFKDRQFYEPVTFELNRMERGLTPEGAAYWQRLLDSDTFLQRGVSAGRVADKTGILRMPRVNMEGDVLGDPRKLFGATPDEMAVLRPDRANYYGFRVNRDVKPEYMGDAGYFLPDPGREELWINPLKSQEEQDVTEAHEMTHADQYISQVPEGEGGTSPEDAAQDRLDSLNSLDSRIKETTDPTERARLKDQYRTLRGTSPTELYFRNPGEMLANLSSGERGMAKQLNFSQSLNPHINKDKGLFERVADAVTQVTLADTTPHMTYLQRKNIFPFSIHEGTHRGVPIDVSKAIVGSPPKSRGGALELARHATAVGRAGGQVAPSKYMPNVPRAVHADGGAANAPMFQGIHPDLQGEGGAPLDLYHGTTQDKEFEAFDDAKLGKRDAGFYGRGHYLTPDKSGASEYAGDDPSQGTLIGPLHAALKNPYVWDISDDMKSNKTLRDLQSMGIMKEKNKLEPWDNLQQHHIQPFMAEMKKRGHDGVVVKTAYEHHPNGISEVVAFDPKTIKHAEAEAFDPTDPRIRREDGGEVSEENEKANLAQWYGKGSAYRGNIWHHITDNFPIRMLENKPMWMSEDPDFTGHASLGSTKSHALHTNVKNPFQSSEKQLAELSKRVKLSDDDLKALRNPEDTDAAGTYQIIERPDVFKAIQDMGHDAAEMHENSTRNLVVFKPQSSVKSISKTSVPSWDAKRYSTQDFNQGTFDPSDPDITKADGGEVDGGDGIVVYQGRSKKGIKSFFNPSGQSWGTTQIETAKQFAGENESFYPRATPRRMETSYNGEVHRLRFKIKNPMRVSIKDTMWDAGKERDKIEEAKSKGHDGLEIYHNPEKSDFVAFNPDQVEHLDSHTPDTRSENYQTGGAVDGDEDGITAYHGSPHSFDQFNIANLGTGEGAQAYGHGLYFAGNEGIAKHYRDALTTGLRSYTVDGVPASKLHGSLDPADSLKMNYAQQIREGKSHDDAINFLKTQYKGKLTSRFTYPEDIPYHKEQLARLEEMQAKPPEVQHLSGHMYKVKLNVKPHELLDWDKPLSEQPHVLSAIDERYGDPEIVMQQLGHDLNTATGRDFHDSMAGTMGDNRGAAQKLQDMGLKGIRYLDASSRDMFDGDPTHNYVMFHHDPVKVVDKYEYGGFVPQPQYGSVGVSNGLYSKAADTVRKATGGQVMGYVPMATLPVSRLAVARAPQYQQQAPAARFSESLNSLMDTVEGFKKKPEAEAKETPSGTIAMPDDGYEATGMYAPFQSAIDQMIADAPGKITVTSGYRTPERQEELWNEHAAKYPDPEVRDDYVARPGQSSHNYGLAADLSYADEEALKWAHENAAKYGLNFRMGHEDWHIEPANIWELRNAMTVPEYASGGKINKALSLTRGFTKDGKSAISALKSKGK